MTTAADLLAELEDCISRPAAEDLRECVIRDNRAGALEIIQGERFSLEHAEILYDYCRVQWGGIDVDLVEIPMAKATETLAMLDAAAGDDENRRPRYVVRDGTRLTSTWASFERGEWCIFLRESGYVPLSRIRQLWHIRPTVASAPNAERCSPSA
jgi:hypothetical protein